MKKRLLYILLALPATLLLAGISSCNNVEHNHEDLTIDEGATELVAPPDPPSLAPPDSAQTPEPEEAPTPEQTPEPEETPTSTPAPTPTPSFGFIDAHADSISRALELPENSRSLFDNDALHVDFRRLLEFGTPLQFFALWTSTALVADVYNHTNRMLDFFEEQVENHSGIIEIARDFEDILRIANSGKITAILSIEGGEALMGDIENLTHFYNRGVRSLGLLWNRENELGFGWPQGRTQGLTPFGIDVIQKMDELGIIMDVSHLNEAGFWDAHNASTRPYMASHSNAYAVTPHNRNLNDDQILAIAGRGGVIGFNMFPRFVSSNNTATMEDIMAHFHHFYGLGVINNIVLGADFDGITSTPQGITCVLSLKHLRERLANEFCEDIAHGIMEGNFFEFLKRYFGG